MDHRAMDYTLEISRRRGVAAGVGD